jgi:hypothetical protein
VAAALEASSVREPCSARRGSEPRSAAPCLACPVPLPFDADAACAQRLRDTSAQPWAFADGGMEGRFRAERVAGLFERMRPVHRVWIPANWVTSACLLLVRLPSLSDMSAGETAISAARLVMVAVHTALYGAELSDATKAVAGRVSLWVHRCWPIVVLQQTGVYQHDQAVLFMLVYLLFFAGLVFPSFPEYLVASAASACARPAALLLARAAGTGGEPVTSALVLYPALLGTAAAINYRLHSESRREWLLSAPSAPGPSAPSIAPAELSPAAVPREGAGRCTTGKSGEAGRRCAEPRLMKTGVEGEKAGFDAVYQARHCCPYELSALKMLLRPCRLLIINVHLLVFRSRSFLEVSSLSSLAVTLS